MGYLKDEPISFRVQGLIIGITREIEQNKEPYWILYVKDKNNLQICKIRIDDWEDGYNRLKLAYLSYLEV